MRTRIRFGAPAVLIRWDVDVRESVLGVAGAGGIGFVLNGPIVGLEWARVGILGVVALSSAWVRRRLT